MFHLSPVMLGELKSKEEDGIITVAFYNLGTMERHLPHMIFYLFNDPKIVRN